MNTLQTTGQNSQAVTTLPMRELLKEQQNAWIERIFARLGTIYGSEFIYKYADIDQDELKRTWSSMLGGFHAEDIAAALTACLSLPKAPNAPEFAALCRQNMNVRSTTVQPEITKEERIAAAKIADKVASEFKAENNAKGYEFNGVLVTPYKQWAVNLLKREANGESIPYLSSLAWREVLGFEKDYPVKNAFEKLKQLA